jgi:ABC-type antimicrobial peptide transport system permease subunit
MILSEGVRFVAAGVVVGAIAAFVVTRSMSRLLFGVSQHDPVTFAGVALLLVAVAFTATYVPARRAARVDPSVALRME